MIIVAPAHQRQVVDQRLSNIAILAIFHDRYSVVALAQLAHFTWRIENERYMYHYRHRKAQGLIQQDIKWHAGYVFLPADDMRDVHQIIVYHMTQFVGWHTIRLEQYAIIKRSVIKCN